MYHGSYGVKFNFGHCWAILKGHKQVLAVMPKRSLNGRKRKNAVPGSEEVEEGTTRPIDRKAAKLVEKTQNLDSGVKENYILRLIEAQEKAMERSEKKLELMGDCMINDFLSIDPSKSTDPMWLEMYKM